MDSPVDGVKRKIRSIGQLQLFQEENAPLVDTSDLYKAWFKIDHPPFTNTKDLDRWFNNRVKSRDLPGGSYMIARIVKGFKASVSVSVEEIKP